MATPLARQDAAEVAVNARHGILAAEDADDQHTLEP